VKLQSPAERKRSVSTLLAILSEDARSRRLLLDWEEVTRNCHVGKLDGVRVAASALRSPTTAWPSRRCSSPV
jgi:hypothetical protein